MISPTTGEILTDQYSRPFGSELWRGGPTLGGRQAAQFAQARDRRRSEQARVDFEPDFTPGASKQRQAGALRYLFASFGSDAEPLAMVESILRGERDDVVRSLAGERRAA